MILGLVIISLIGAILTAIVVWPHYCISLISKASTQVRWIGNQSRNEVALTIDDGPDPIYTPEILDILKARGIKATFFVVGGRVGKYPEIVERMCTEGHEIGNHTGSWRRTIFIGQKEFANDLEAADGQLRGFACATRFFRPAGIWIRPAQLQILKLQGYICVLGSTYAHDPARPPSQYISWVIGRGLRPGAIAVIHDSGGDRSRTVKALPGIIDAAERKRLKFVPLSRVMEK